MTRRMRSSFRRLAALALLVVAVLPVEVAASQAHLAGSASIETPVALPPGAVFEAVLEDVSGTGAQGSIELGRKTIPDPGTAPFAFDIAYDPADVDADRTYSVRAQVSVGRRLVYVSESVTPVLTGGAPGRADVHMIKVADTAAEAREAPSSIGAHGLRLPASFDGDLPCPDCTAIQFRLNLWPDQVFHLRRNWKGKEIRRDSIGRWSVDADSEVLQLRGAGEELELQIVGPDQLRLLGQDGAPTDDSPAYVLTAAPAFVPFEPQLPLRGMLTYTAKEARFTECLTGRDYPLVEDGDYEALEHAYLAAGAEAGGPIMASFDGEITQVPKADGSGGTQAAVMVERFVGVWPDETCERTLDAAQLTNTYWKILRLGDTEVAASEGLREPNLILRAGDPRFTATVGCNQITGTYEQKADRLAFGAAAGTRMACPPPLDAWETQLSGLLADTAGWRIDGQTLELLDDAGNPLALLQAVYLY